MKAIGGRLKFKGENADLKKRKRVDREKEPAEKVEQLSAVEEPFEVKIEAGKGRITSSGVTVQGHETAFMDQLSVGDAIIITHPSTLADETKVVRMVLSNTSIGISSAFSRDLISTTEFRFVKAPKVAQDLEREQERKRERLQADEKAAVGTYASAGGSVFTYRVKKEGASGGYKIITESVSGGAKTRGELLDMRATKKADRHCY